MSEKGHDIVVIGTSAGGAETLENLIGQLTADFVASIFIVQHMHPEHSSNVLLNRLCRQRIFKCQLAVDDEVFKRRNIYIAPPDAHMLIKEKTLKISRGAKENRYRPAVDPLFRSAAVAHGPHVVGVILTGMLDDGTAGLRAIHRCGGVTVVQDPSDAPYPEMPQSALNNVHIDYCVPVAKMGRLLEKINHQIPKNLTEKIPDDIRIEAEIAERVLSGIDGMNRLGNLAPYSCPSCGGTLWEIDDPVGIRYRCYTGHSFSAASFLDEQAEKIEETLWVAMRMFEERKNLLQNAVNKQNDRPKVKQIYEKHLIETQTHIDRLRAMLLATNKEEASPSVNIIKAKNNISA